MINISIFTCNSFDKVHPRIEMQKRILEAKGYNVNIVRASLPKEKGYQGLLNMRSLKYFRWGAIKEFKQKIDQCDIAHIYDFQLLPLAEYAKKKKKKVIYETLDDNVFLHFYALAKRLPFLPYFKTSITNYFASKERKDSERFCDKVIVNSKNLLSKFIESKTTLIYYASGLKLSNHQFDSTKEVKFIYVGKMTIDKGAEIYDQLIREYNKKMIFYGHYGDNESRNLFEGNSLVEERGNKNIQDLIKSLRADIESYNLIGFSIVLPVNESYKYQEANKDIDYITMSIPFVGNTRPPTLEKINRGFGVLYTDSNGIMNLLTNKYESYNNIILEISKNGNEYSEKCFQEKFLKVYSDIL